MLLDVMMPVMDGAATLVRLREIRERPVFPSSS